MPIVIATFDDFINDTMMLVSMHKRSVLVAALDPSIDMLRFMYVSPPCSVLKVVDAEKDEAKVSELFTRAKENGLLTFRVKFWRESTVAYVFSEYEKTQESV